MWCVTPAINRSFLKEASEEGFLKMETFAESGTIVCPRSHLLIAALVNVTCHSNSSWQNVFLKKYSVFVQNCYNHTEIDDFQYSTKWSWLRYARSIRN